MKKTVKYTLLAGVVAVLAACATGVIRNRPSDPEIKQVLLASFENKGQAKLERLNQTRLQAICSDSNANNIGLSLATRSELEKAALESVVYPLDRQYLGDWKSGEAVAQTGVGFQFSDKPDTPAGGNCYACHQLAPTEISYGNIGPSLLHYGKLRGNSEEIMKYTWAKIWNSHSYNACSNMPRFGAAGILTETQLKAYRYTQLSWLKSHCSHY